MHVDAIINLCICLLQGLLLQILEGGQQRASVGVLRSLQLKSDADAHYYHYCFLKKIVWFVEHAETPVLDSKNGRNVSGRRPINYGRIFL